MFRYKDKLYDVVVIRSIAIIMVVAFHAYYMMMVPGHFPDTADVYRNLYWSTNNVILQFRMPLFIFISGYLSFYVFLAVVPVVNVTHNAFTKDPCWKILNWIKT